MDEVEVVGGGYELHTYEDAQGGGLATLGITAYRTTPAQPTYTPTNNYLTPSFNSPSLMYGSLDSMNWCGPVNGGFASQDAQLQCYADWYNAGFPDIQGQSGILSKIGDVALLVASAAFNFTKAVDLCRNNTDPNTVVVQDATKLHVVQVTEFDSDGKASAHLSYDDPLWDVFGQVTLLKQSDGSITIANDKFDFDMKPWTLGTTLRNTLTAIGEALATGFGAYTCTPFNIEFQGSPIIVSGPKP